MDEAFLSVACGNTHTIAVTQTGSAYSWGHGPHGQLGLTSSCLFSATPCRIDSLAGTSVVAAVAGESHSALLSSDGALFTFGDGRHGKLGVTGSEDCVNQLRPFRVRRLAKTLRVHCAAAGGTHTVVLARPLQQVALNGREDSEEDDPMDSCAAKSPRPLSRHFDRSSLSGSFRARKKRQAKQARAMWILIWVTKNAS